MQKIPGEIQPAYSDVGDDKTKSTLHGEIRPFPGNASTVEYFQHFLQASPATTSRTALIFEEQNISFGELDSMSTKLALVIGKLIDEKSLQNRNPDGDWVIAICLPPSANLIFCIFAIHKLGAAYVPIDNTFPENRVLSMVDSCKPVLVISDSVASTVSKFDAVADQTEVVTLNDLLTSAGQTDAADVTPLPSEVKTMSQRVAIVLYTSGSSGTPKGVRLRHSAIMNRLHWQWEAFPYSEAEKCCFKTALTFVDSVAEIFGPLLRGHAINIFSKLIVSNPNLLIKKIEATGITRIVVVPSLLRALLSTLDLLRSDEVKGAEKLNSVKLWVCSGETLQKDLLDDFFVQFPAGTTLANFYGSTEVMADVSAEIFTSAENVSRQVPIGSPIFNTVLYVLSPEMNVVPLGDIGELYVAGYNLCSGYVGIDNADKLVPNPFSKETGFDILFKTGDFVRIGEQNGRRTVFYEGRSDSQVKVRGQRVDLNEIETVLNGHGDLINRAFVLCYNAGKEDQAIVAFVVPASQDVTAEQINARAKASLKPYEIPEIKIISDVPLLVNGKVDRQRLLSSFDADRNKNEKRDSDEALTLTNIPAQLKEQALALIKSISEVTHASQRDIVDNFSDSFFNLGGTSLNSVTVVTKLRMNNFHIALDDFVRAGTLREMVNKIRPIASGGGPSALTVNTEETHVDFYAEFLSKNVMTDASEIIAYSFARKGDLEVYTNASFQDFRELIINLYPTLLEKGLSFIVRRKADKKAVATALNFDLADEPESVEAAAGIATVLEFLEVIESRQREKLPKGINKIIHSFMMGTHESVSVAENVPLVTFMEKEITRIAKKRGFLGIMTTNTNPLTMQVCSELLGYETLIEYQVNQYQASDGSKPFKLAPDSQIVNCCWKQLELEGIPAFPASS